MFKSIRLVNVSKKFKEADKETVLFEDLSFVFEQGRSYAIMGVSGIGKSTLLHIIAGLEPINKGAVFFEDVDIFKMGNNQKNEYLLKNLGIIFQEPNLIQELNVCENIILKGLNSKNSNSDVYGKAKNLLVDFGLKDKENSYPKNLSGGQQQRVAILRAIFNDPDFILADEPTGSLDSANSNQIIDILINRTKLNGSGLVISTHDMNVAKKMDFILTIKDRKLELI